jgi:hypothetical protein
VATKTGVAVGVDVGVFVGVTGVFVGMGRGVAEGVGVSLATAGEGVGSIVDGSGVKVGGTPGVAVGKTARTARVGRAISEIWQPDVSNIPATKRRKSITRGTPPLALAIEIELLRPDQVAGFALSRRQLQASDENDGCPFSGLSHEQSSGCGNFVRDAHVRVL